MARETWEKSLFVDEQNLLLLLMMIVWREERRSKSDLVVVVGVDRKRLCFRDDKSKK